MSEPPKWMKFEAGQTFHLENGVYPVKIHIVNVIDEGLHYCPLIVFRWFGRHKQWWHYEIKSAFLLTGDIERYKKDHPNEQTRHEQPAQSEENSDTVHTAASAPDSDV